VLQCVAVCCSVLQYVSVCCSVLQCVAVYSADSTSQILPTDNLSFENNLFELQMKANPVFPLKSLIQKFAHTSCVLSVFE